MGRAHLGIKARSVTLSASPPSNSLYRHRLSTYRLPQPQQQAYHNFKDYHEPTTSPSCFDPEPYPQQPTSVLSILEARLRTTRIPHCPPYAPTQGGLLSPDPNFFTSDCHTELQDIIVSPPRTMAFPRSSQSFPMEDDSQDAFFMANQDFGLVPAQPNPRYIVPSGSDDGVRSVPLPGVRCPKCAKEGKEVWVIPGRACGYCGTACV